MAEPPDRARARDERSWASSPAIRRTMQGNRRRDTAPEMLVRRLLHAAGLRYRVDWPLPFDRRRRADIAFTRQKVVVFIDGCFWHGCERHYVPPRSNAAYWAEKVASNAARDRDTDERLVDDGWRVMRFWEHEAPERIATTVASIVRQAPCTNVSRSAVGAQGDQGGDDVFRGHLGDERPSDGLQHEDVAQAVEPVGS